MSQLFSTVSRDLRAYFNTSYGVLVSLKIQKQYTRQGQGPLKGAMSALKAPQVCDTRELMRGSKKNNILHDEELLICPPGNS